MFKFSRPPKRRRVDSRSHVDEDTDRFLDDGFMDYEHVATSTRFGSSRVPVPPLQPPAAACNSIPQPCAEARDTAETGGVPGSEACPAGQTGPDAPELEQETSPGSHWKRTSAAMQEFLSRRRTVLNALFSHEYDPRVSASCDCSTAGLRAFRCLDCFCSTPMCQVCMVAAHQHAPFHHIQRWAGSYFARDSLHHIDLELCLGHGGARCPNAIPKVSKTLVAVHCNGVHRLRVVYCECAGRQRHPVQLLLASLYPATWDSPATVFSFELPDKYHLDSLRSRTSAHDFWAVLSGLTDNTRPDAVPDRYEDLLRVSREWRVLMRWKRSGQAMGISELLPNRTDSVAVLCPACPQPGLNMEPDWEELVNEDNLHIYTVFIGIDGNFRAVLKKKRFDPMDRPLLDGQGYFASTEAFAEYMKKHELDEPGEHQSTCADLKSMKSLTRRKGIVVAGVAAVFCRHSLYQPGAMVDLKLGEKFRVLDYAVAQALLANPHPRLNRILTCDKGCQYGVNLIPRFETAFPALVPIVTPMKVLVPKMHLQGHKEDCRYRFSLNYTRYCGRTDGEHVERPWLDSNETSKITRDQNPGHRKDTYDDTNGAWNHGKDIRMSSALLVTLRKMYAKRAEAIDGAAALDSAVGAENIAAWSRLSREPHDDEDGEVVSVYRVDRAKLPTYTDVVAALKRADATPAHAGSAEQPMFSAASFLTLGLEIELAQDALLAFIEKLPKGKLFTREYRHDLCLRRRQLRDDISAFRLLQQIHMPQLGPMPDSDVYTTRLDEDFGCPEEEQLNFPSEWASAADRRRFGFSELEEPEYKLRLVRASRELVLMRGAIHAYNAFFTWKQKNISGQKQGTRASTQVASNAKEIHTHAASYRRHYKAMTNLGIKPGDARTFQPLLDSDLAHFHVHAGNPEGLGESQRPQAWFWGGDRDADEKAAEDLEKLTLEELRVRWFRARANKERFCEEVEILHAEIARTHRMFGSMKDIWTALAERQDMPSADAPDNPPGPPFEAQATMPKEREIPNSLQGRQAYARKQGSIYAQRQWDAERSCVAAQHLQDNYSPPQKSRGPRKKTAPGPKYTYEWSFY